MYLTEKQKLLLYQILVDSLRISGDPFRIPLDQRLKLINEIINQQDNEFNVESIPCETKSSGQS